MKATTVHVAGASMDTIGLTLILTNGETEFIPQGDPRIKPLLAKIVPICSAGGVATVDLGETVKTPFNLFKEEKTGIKFLRVAKDFVKKLFSSEKEGELPTNLQVGAQKAPVTMEKAIQDILANAQPASEITKEDLKDETESTVVAVIDDKTVLTEVSNLASQVNHVNNGGSEKALANFMRRVAAVASIRRHSAEDLMRFMQKGDLPIAEDGSIIAYKALLKTQQGGYVDIHTGNVWQHVGSKVRMDEKLVDPSRYNDCSHGLHIARRAYLGGFGGDAIVLCKIAPEDVIAVPQYDGNKVRVCAYHILGELPEEDRQSLRKDKPVSTTKGLQLLHDALQGTHIGVLKETIIGGNLGTRLSYVDHVKPEPESTPIPVVTEEEKPEVKQEDVVIKNYDPVKTATAEPVDPLKVVEEVQKTKAVATSANSPREKINSIICLQGINSSTAKQIVDLKRKAKKSWSALGVSDVDRDDILKALQ